MKTKTPKQINDQFNRILNNLFEVTDWLEVDFENISEAKKKRYDRVSDIALGYIDNIFSYNNCKNSISVCKTEQYQNILHNAAETRKIYAGY